MAINLVKGDNFSLSNSLSHVSVGLGWDPSRTPGNPYDLDASAFMLGHNGRLIADEYFVFYNNQISPDGAVQSSGDDLTGGNSDGGDDEKLSVDLVHVNPRVQEILFTVTIHKAEERGQNFGQVHNAYIRIYNEENQQEIARYDLNEDFSVEPRLNLAVSIVASVNGNSKHWESVEKEVFNSLLTNTDKYNYEHQS